MSRRILPRLLAALIAMTGTARADRPAPPPSTADLPSTAGVQADGATLPHEDWLTTPVPKPKVGVYHGCKLYVPEDAAQEEKVNRAEPVGKFRNTKDARSEEKPEERVYRWCRDAAGEREVDILANHDRTAATTLAHTLQAHRLLEQTLAVDLEIGQKRAALTDDLKQQVAGIRDDVRKEIEINQAQRTWTIAGWSLAGAFLLTSIVLGGVVALK